MSKIEHNKLVRDKIPSIIEKNGDTAIIRILSEDNYQKELLKKIVEEAQEVQEAGNDTKSLTKEIGDVLEVIEHIIKAYKLNPNDITEVKRTRKHERGGFSEKIFLESTNDE